MLLVLPEELENALDDSDKYSIPILKDGATDKQKIVYADFIKELVTSDKKRYAVDEPFFKK